MVFTLRWVQSAVSNKALELLNAEALDFGSTAGAALIGRAGGDHSVDYVFPHPEWTALVTQEDPPIQAVTDLHGQRVAVTRGINPHVLLIRALAEAELSERDVKPMLLQPAD